MADSSPQLDYAPQPSWRSRKGTRRAIITGALLLGLLASFKWIWPGWDHARLLYYQHRCLTHAEPARSIIYDGDSPANINTNFPSGIVASDWDRFYTLYSPPGGRFNATAFLGELRQNDGSPRLVAIDAETIRFADPPFAVIPFFNIHVIKPGGIWSQPQLCTNTNWRMPYETALLLMFKFKDISVRKIHPGQRDLDRRDHFTITVERAGGPQIIDGWLQADDTILLELRR